MSLHSSDSSLVTASSVLVGYDMIPSKFRSYGQRMHLAQIGRVEYSTHNSHNRVGRKNVRLV